MGSTLFVPTAVGASDTLYEGETPIRFQLDSPNALAQLAANRTYAEHFVANHLALTIRPSSSSALPRVLVSGFGRFLTHDFNASAHIVTRLLNGVEPPSVSVSDLRGVHSPAEQTLVQCQTVAIDQHTDVELCVLVLPVFWDLAPWLLLNTIKHFQPSIVLMNGIAAERQPIYLEHACANYARVCEDGSGHLRPEIVTERGGEVLGKLVLDEAESLEDSQLRAAWGALEQAAQRECDGLGDVRESDVNLSSILSGVSQQSQWSESNSYLCNSVAYLCNHAMLHPTRALRFFEQTSDPLTLALMGEWSAVSRAFIHWPSDLRGKHIDCGAAILRAMISAQVRAQTL